MRKLLLFLCVPQQVVMSNGIVTYKLSDVGLARVTDPSGMLFRKSGGCIQYIAPEIPTGGGT